MNNLRFHYTSAAILAVVGTVLTIAVEFGAHLSQDNIDSINRLVGLILGGIVVGGAFKSRAMLARGISEAGGTVTSRTGLGLHFTQASIVALVGAVIACAVSFGFHLTQENIQSILTLVGLVAGGLTFGGGVKSAGLIDVGAHKALPHASSSHGSGRRHH
jgi:intracellular septation protein A